MTQWIQQLLWHSVAMSVIVLAYYAATTWLRKRYAAKWFYLAGIILLIGFLIPFPPSISVQMERVPEFLQGIAEQEANAQSADTGAMSPARGVMQASPWHVAFLIWIAGMLGMLLSQGVKHALFVRTINRWRVDVRDPELIRQFRTAKRALQLDDRDIGLAFCACISSPMLIQLDKPTVLLPDNVRAAYDTHFILLHELIHSKRRDLLCRLVMLLATAMHWFNPAIYLLVRLVTLQCEISCDERVVENQDFESKHQYVMSIIGVAQNHSRGYTLLTTQFNGGKDTMKKRIHSIYEPTKTKLGVLLLACALLMTMVAGTSIAADTGNSEISYTLPEAPVKFNEKLDSYVVSWEPINGIKEYYLGVYYATQVKEVSFVNPLTDEVETTTEMWSATKGWVGPGTVTDGDGKEYDVEMGIWESVTLPGDATEVDISELINKQLDPIELDTDVNDSEYAEKEALLSCTMMITAVRESGEEAVPQTV